jgi:hypothetical protein
MLRGRRRRNIGRWVKPYIRPTDYNTATTRHRKR